MTPPISTTPVSTTPDSTTPAASEPVLRITNLSVRFPGSTLNAVSDVSLQVSPGEVLALVGESGSGKTVTARAALGLLPPEVSITGSITVLVDGAPVELVQAPEERWRGIRGGAIAMVFQEPQTALNPVKTVGWQLDQVLRAHGWRSAAERRRRAVELLGLVGIPDPEQRIRRFPHEFSGGQKQRVVIAIALAAEPSLLIADEPTTALDVTVQQEILDLLDSLRHQLGTAVLLITHNMGVVADLADRVHVLRSARTVEEAEVEDLFHRPEQPYTKALLAAVPRLPEIAAVATEDVRAEAATVADPVVSFSGVHLGYPGRLGQAGTPVLHGVDFTVGRGEVVGVVGESGSGKTTLTHAIIGSLRQTAGSIEVLGADLSRTRGAALRAVRRRIGVVHQDPALTLDPRFTVAEAIAEPLLVHRDPQQDRASINRRVDDLLDAVALPTSLRTRLPHELSGGQRQRVALARALVLGPDLLLADEPTSALDVTVQAQVLDLFEQLQHRFGFSCVFVSHDLAVIHRIATRVVVLRAGRLVEQGSTDEVLVRPREDYTRRLVAAVPLPDPVRQRERRRVALAG